MDITSDPQNSVIPSAPKHSIFRTVMIVMGVLFVILIFILVLVFVIPRTNIFRFNDDINDQISQQITH